MKLINFKKELELHSKVRVIDILESNRAPAPIRFIDDIGYIVEIKGDDKYHDYKVKFNNEHISHFDKWNFLEDELELVR